MTRKYKEYTDYIIEGETYWYASLFHMVTCGGTNRYVEFGTKRYIHAHFHILLEGV